MRPLSAIVLVVGVTLGCARVDHHVELPDVPVGAGSFVRAVEAYTSTPVLGGNAVDVLLNGDEIFPAMLAAIRQARRTINYAQYSYNTGRIAAEVAEALAERCRAGVEVNVLVDAVGSSDFEEQNARRLRDAGCRLEFFRPVGRLAVDRLNNRNHRRVLVVDGRVAFTGGSGVNDKWTGNGRLKDHWRDTDVRVRGPAVEYLQGAFAESWLEATGVVIGGEAHFPPPEAGVGSARTHVVRSSPARGSFAMYTVFLLAMAGARRSISITNPYFLPDERMMDALGDAVARGVRVTVLVPGEIDHNLVRQASRRLYGRMLQMGVAIHEYRGSLLHAKTMVVDGEWATVGSTNLDNRSFAMNDELNVAVHDRAVAERMERIFSEDLRHAPAVRYAEWRARPLRERALEVLTTPVRDLL